MKQKLILAAAFVAAVAGARPALAQSMTGPVAADAFITVGGFDWAWAGPCRFEQPSCLSSWVLVDGFNFATQTQWDARPDPTQFLDPAGNFFDDFAGVQMRCASAWFVGDPADEHCDYDDAVLGFVSSGAIGGLGDPDFDPLDETWLVRPSGANESVTPEPATMSLVATGLVGMVGMGRRRKRTA